MRFVLEGSPVAVFKKEDNMLGGETPGVTVLSSGDGQCDRHQKISQEIFVSLLWCSSIVMAIEVLAAR